MRGPHSVLAEPLEDCLAADQHGQPCIEVLAPLDLERELRMPRGHRAAMAVLESEALLTTRLRRDRPLARFATRVNPLLVLLLARR